MKKQCLISTLSLAIVLSGISFSAPASAEIIGPGQPVMTIDEILALRVEAEAELTEACGEDLSCQRRLYDSRIWQNYENEYRALNGFLEQTLIVTAVNPSAKTMRVMYNNQNIMDRWWDEESSEENVAADLRMGWSEPEHSMIIYDYNGIPDKSEAPDYFHYMYFSNSESENEGWLTPYQEFSISWEDEGFGPASNFEGIIQFVIKDKKDRTNMGGIWLTDCLYSRYYEPGAECRATFSKVSGARAYVPYKDGVPAYPYYNYGNDSGEENSSENNSSAENTPTEDVSNENSSADDAPVEDTPIENTPVEDTSGGNTPTEGGSSNDTSVVPEPEPVAPAEPDSTTPTIPIGPDNSVTPSAPVKKPTKPTTIAKPSKPSSSTPAEPAEPSMPTTPSVEPSNPESATPGDDKEEEILNDATEDVDANMPAQPFDAPIVLPVLPVLPSGSLAVSLKPASGLTTPASASTSVEESVARPTIESSGDKVVNTTVAVMTTSTTATSAAPDDVTTEQTKAERPIGTAEDKATAVNSEPAVPLGGEVNETVSENSNFSLWFIVPLSVAAAVLTWFFWPNKHNR